MKLIETISENEMVLAFLKAEIDSPRFGSHVKQGLVSQNSTRDIIDNPDLQNDSENLIRGNCLESFRGYQTNQFLFQGFPNNIVWKRASVAKTELENFKYANYPTWVELSQGSRLVSDGASNINTIQIDDININVKAVEKLIRLGKSFPELILVSKSQNDNPVLIEGHTRATAYSLAKDALPDEIEVLVGFSDQIDQWCFY
jgi:hypothetical protein